MIGTNPFSVHEVSVGVFHAWGDGYAVAGPTDRHLRPLVDEFRAGMRMNQDGAGEDERGAFGEWRRHAPDDVSQGGWMVEFSVPLGGTEDAQGVAISSLLPAGAPVVLVVRFFCRDTGVWRVFQFHDAVALPADVADESQKMMRVLKFSAGLMEEFKSGVMPAVVPSLRGVIEWRHLGRVVRCWEYDAAANEWQEDAENVQVVSGETVRYVTLDSSTAPGTMVVSYLAALSQAGVVGGLAASELGWLDAECFTVDESSGLTFAPGWELEAEGCAEPLLLRASDQHWEHPRVVFRFLGRIYGTARAGVFAVPRLVEGSPDEPLDFPLRLGRLVMYPEGAYLLDPE